MGKENQGIWGGCKMGLEKSVKNGESRLEIKVQEQVEAAECGGIAIDKYTDYNNPQASTGNSSHATEKYSHLYWAIVLD